MLPHRSVWHRSVWRSGAEVGASAAAGGEGGEPSAVASPVEVAGDSTTAVGCSRVATPTPRQGASAAPPLPAAAVPSPEAGSVEVEQPMVTMGAVEEPPDPAFCSVVCSAATRSQHASQRWTSMLSRTTACAPGMPHGHRRERSTSQHAMHSQRSPRRTRLPFAPVSSGTMRSPHAEQTSPGDSRDRRSASGSYWVSPSRAQLAAASWASGARATDASSTAAIAFRRLAGEPGRAAHARSTSGGVLASRFALSFAGGRCSQQKGEKSEA